jgi:hypothetical protein
MKHLDPRWNRADRGRRIGSIIGFGRKTVGVPEAGMPMLENLRIVSNCAMT